MTDTVSVVLPFRNEARWLPGALSSLAVQTLRSFDAVLVDDCSTDGSPGLAETFARKDPRFRVVRSPGSGLVEALNAGLREARGEWVARMDADDLCHPERLELQLELARSLGERSVVSSLAAFFPRRALSTGALAYQEWLNGLTAHRQIVRDIFVESPIPHPSAFFHRRSVLEAGGYLDGGLPEDYELWLRLWSLGFVFEKVPRHLLAWRERPDRYSRVSSRYSLNSFYRTKARYLSRVPCLQGKRVLVAGSGQTARRLSRWMIAEGFFIEAFLCLDPRQSGSTMRGRPVVESERVVDFAGVPVVTASREPGARKRIRGFLSSRGLVEGKDFVVCS